MNNEQQSKKIGDIMAKCWADESFKQKLLADANATLKAEGIDIPAGITVNIVENTSQVINYVLPRNPKAELSDADLEQAAGGKGCVGHDMGPIVYKDDKRYDPDAYHGPSGMCYVGGASGQKGAF